MNTRDTEEKKRGGRQVIRTKWSFYNKGKDDGIEAKAKDSLSGTYESKGCWRECHPPWIPPSKLHTLLLLLLAQLLSYPQAWLPISPTSTSSLTIQTPRFVALLPSLSSHLCTLVSLHIHQRCSYFELWNNYKISHNIPENIK